MKCFPIFCCILMVFPILCQANYASSASIDSILVEKEKRLMTVFNKDQTHKSYRIALGFDPKGHKTRQGDGKTPEGIYYIVHKNPNSKFHLSLKLSYPSLEDINLTKQSGIDPGGHIMIHGLPSHLHTQGKWHRMRDWTLGCIAVTNEEIEEIFQNIQVGTRVEITP